MTPYLNCGVTFTLWTCSMTSMSSPVQTSLLHPLHLNFTSAGFSFFMSFLFLLFILTFSSIIAWNWNPRICWEDREASSMDQWRKKMRYEVHILVFHSLLDWGFWFFQWLCPSCSCGTHWHTPFQSPQSSSLPPQCKCCPQLFLDLETRKWLTVSNCFYCNTFQGRQMTWLTWIIAISLVTCPYRITKLHAAISNPSSATVVAISKLTSPARNFAKTSFCSAWYRCVSRWLGVLDLKC